MTGRSREELAVRLKDKNSELRNVEQSLLALREENAWMRTQLQAAVLEADQSDARKQEVNELEYVVSLLQTQLQQTQQALDEEKALNPLLAQSACFEPRAEPPASYCSACSSVLVEQVEAAQTNSSSGISASAAAPESPLPSPFQGDTSATSAADENEATGGEGNGGWFTGSVDESAEVMGNEATGGEGNGGQFTGSVAESAEVMGANAADTEVDLRWQSTMTAMMSDGDGVTPSDDWQDGLCKWLTIKQAEVDEATAASVEMKCQLDTAVESLETLAAGAVLAGGSLHDKAQLLSEEVRECLVHLLSRAVFAGWTREPASAGGSSMDGQQSNRTRISPRHSPCTTTADYTAPGTIRIHN